MPRHLRLCSILAALLFNAYPRWQTVPGSQTDSERRLTLGVSAVPLYGLPGLSIETQYRPAREVGAFGQEDDISVISITRTRAMEPAVA